MTATINVYDEIFWGIIFLIFLLTFYVWLARGKKSHERKRKDQDWLVSQFSLQKLQRTFQGVVRTFQGFSTEEAIYRIILLGRGEPSIGFDLVGGEQYPAHFQNPCHRDETPISMEHQPRISFYLKKGKHRHRIKKGIINKLKIGDVDFDDQVCIDSLASDSFLQLLLNKKEIRRLVLELLGDGWTELRLFDGTSVVSLRNGNENLLNRDAGLLQQKLEKMQALQEQLPSIIVQNPHTIIKGRGDGIFLFTVVALVCSIIMTVALNEQYPVFDDNFTWKAMSAGTVVWLVSLFPLWFILRGLYHFEQLFLKNAGILLVAMLLAAKPVGCWLNATTSDAKLQKIELTVLSKRAIGGGTRSRSSTRSEGSYFLTFAETKLTAEAELKVPYSVFVLQGKKTVFADIGQGGFGVPWVDRFFPNQP